MKKILQLSDFRDIALDDPEIFNLEKEIIESKHFLRLIYIDWYEMICNALPGGKGHILEVGSGAGFLESYIPTLIRSDIQLHEGVSVVLNAEHIPVADGSLKAIVMVNVLHHVSEVRSFFSEAARCVRYGGAILMVEPWVSKWSSFIYKNFHHEPFTPMAEKWGFETHGPMTSANGALPWIVFSRDVQKFSREFPSLKVEEIHPIMPLRYILSGGVSRKAILPKQSYEFIKIIDEFLARWSQLFPMFAFIRLSKR